jgi:peroxiredoxin
MRADIVPGATFPDYALPDHRGKRRTLSELQGGDPLVLVLSRGGYCPKDRRQHEGLVQLHREMQVGYCRLVTISTDNLIETNQFRTAAGAPWTFLSDAGRKVQKDLDIAEYTDPHYNPMIPHTLVLEPGLRVFRSTTAIGSSAGPRSRSYASTCAPSCGAVAPTGTSATRSIARRGNGATGRVSFPTGRPRRSCWPSRSEPPRTTHHPLDRFATRVLRGAAKYLAPRVWGSAARGGRNRPSVSRGARLRVSINVPTDTNVQLGACAARRRFGSSWLTVHPSRGCATRTIQP